MTLIDITFCSGLRCREANTCYRFIGHHTFEDNEQYSIAQFSDHKGNCTHYWEKEDDRDFTRRKDKCTD